MKGKYVFISFLYIMIFYILPARAQSKIGNRFIMGSSLTYIWQHNEQFSSTYHELTWNKNIAVNVNDHLYIGLSHQNIFTSGSIESFKGEKNKYSIIGLFSQYDFSRKKKNRFFGELSWNYGNYCTCGNGDPFKKGGLNYLGLGVGYDLPVYKYLSVDLSFVSYTILGEVDKKYGYTQYIVGLNFDLTNKKTQNKR